MRCPYCQAQVLEIQSNCPECNFDAPGADNIFGAPPQMAPGICDVSKVLSETETASLARAAQSLAKSFPQVRVTMAFVPLPENAPVPTFATWMLNRCGLNRPSEVGGLNRSILGVVDTNSRKATVQVGYGLEPFVADSDLQEVLASSAPAFAQGYAPGGFALIEHSQNMLERVWAKLEKTYGIDVEEVAKEEARRMGLLTSAQAPELPKVVNDY